MFDAIVTTSDDPFELADTLAALVAAVVDGALRRVIIVAERQPSNVTMRLIEESGADLMIVSGDVQTRWRAALEKKPAGWTVCLAAGVVPRGDWIEQVMRFTMRAQPGDAGVFQVNGAWTARLAVRLRQLAGLDVIAAGRIVSGNVLTGRMTTLNAIVEDRRAGAGVFPIFIP